MSRKMRIRTNIKVRKSIAAEFGDITYRELIDEFSNKGVSIVASMKPNRDVVTLLFLASPLIVATDRGITDHASFANAVEEFIRKLKKEKVLNEG